MDNPVHFSDYRKVIKTAFFLWVASFVLYSGTIGFGFINFDDHTVLLAHPHLYNENSFFSSLREIAFKSFPREEPLILRDITWAVDSYLFGFKNPSGYHLGNVILNSCNTALVFIFILAMGWTYFEATVITLTFAVLPVHVEPICWIMGRKDLLVTFFMLLGLILHTLYIKNTDRKQKRLLYLLGILMTIGALLSKINALSFFLVLAVHDLFFPCLQKAYIPELIFSLPSLKRTFIRFMPHFFISLFIYFWYKGIISAWGVLDRGIDSSSFMHLENLFTFTPLILALYVKLIFIPFGHSIYYEWPSIHEPMTLFYRFLSVSILVLIIFIVIQMYLRRQDLLFFLICFFLLMLPYLNIIYIGIWMANRYIYFSSFCLLTVAARLILDNTRPYKTACLKCTIFSIWICFIVLNVFQTWKYQQAWRDDHSLWQYETGLANPSFMSYASLAHSFVSKAQNTDDGTQREHLLKQAENTVRQGLDKFKSSSVRETTPHLFKLYFVRGLIRQLKGESFEKQLMDYQKAYELKPRQTDVLRKMAEIHYRMAISCHEADKKEELAKISFSFFEKYLINIKMTPSLKQQNLRLLEKTYEANFLFLKSKIIKVKKNYFHINGHSTSSDTVQDMDTQPLTNIQ